MRRKWATLYHCLIISLPLVTRLYIILLYCERFQNLVLIKCLKYFWICKCIVQVLHCSCRLDYLENPDDGYTARPARCAGRRRLVDRYSLYARGPIAIRSAFDIQRIYPAQLSLGTKLGQKIKVHLFAVAYFSHFKYFFKISLKICSMLTRSVNKDHGEINDSFGKFPLKAPIFASTLGVIRCACAKNIFVSYLGEWVSSRVTHNYANLNTFIDCLFRLCTEILVQTTPKICFVWKIDV